MAVSNAQVAELERRHRDLLNQMADINRRIEREEQRLRQEFEQKVETIKRDTSIKLQEREKAIRELYEEQLNHAVSKQEEELRREFDRVECEYEKVCADISAAKAELVRQTEVIKLEQKEFEEAYRARREAEKILAEQVLQETISEYKRLDAEVPMEWFAPSHLKLYSNRISDISERIRNTWYEIAAAAGENVLLNMRLDRLNVKAKLEKWLNIYTTVCRLIERARVLLYDEFFLLPENAVNTARVFNIIDRKIPKDKVELWSQNKYSSICSDYLDFYKKMSPFCVDGKFIAEENMVAFLQKNYQEYASCFRDSDLYGMKRECENLLDRIITLISSLRVDINSFEERLSIISDNSEWGIIRLLKNAGYNVSSVEPIYDELLNTPILIEFSDNFNTMDFEVIISPVHRLGDATIINFVSWFYPSRAGNETVREIEHIMADAFIAKNISVSQKEIQPSEDLMTRVRNALNEKNRLINGRTN